MRPALILHLYYEDVALKIIDNIRSVADLFDVFVTVSSGFSDRVGKALKTLNAPLEIIPTKNIGRDIGPFLSVIPMLELRGYKIFCKLHTKKGNSGYAGEWRDECIDSLVGTRELVEEIISKFRIDEHLLLAGPRILYKSTSAHMFRNGEAVRRLAQCCYPGNCLPQDWGFFAGTMFWGRSSFFVSFAKLHGNGISFEETNNADDGQLAHAFERVFGLGPVQRKWHIGLIHDSRIEVFEGPGTFSIEPIVLTLAKMHSKRVSGLNHHDIDLSQFISKNNPLLHYIQYANAGLDPNPLFHTAWYLMSNRDVANKANPLSHYMKYGVKEGRLPNPIYKYECHNKSSYSEFYGNSLAPLFELNPLGGKDFTHEQNEQMATDIFLPKRLLKSFDLAVEQAFFGYVVSLPECVRIAAAETMVSVIMPAYNREETIGKAIVSVLKQSHKHFELLVVDDGSTDDTCGQVEAHHYDGRIRLIRVAHKGVSAARNVALREAKGDIIAYLDSDNVWNEKFLEIMACFMLSRRLDCAYSSIELRGEKDEVVGYRGEQFNWNFCLESNYVDLNVFCHRRELIKVCGGFDESLRRMVDWDLILRYTKGREVGFAPFIGCIYYDSKEGDGRITLREPIAYFNVVQTKNRRNLHAPSQRKELAKSISLRFSIKVPAPYGERQEWGDFHFAESLKESLERHGHAARIDFRGEWYDREPSQDDVVIVMRGLIPYTPRAGQINILWNISHPDQISYEEYEGYTLVYVSSISYAQFLRSIIKVPVKTLLQATDITRFKYNDPDLSPRHEVLFVGNSRNEFRNMVKWVVDLGCSPAVFGTRWEQFISKDLIKGENIANRELSFYYSGAGVTLNDHWESMREFGFISNRIFDVLASGGRVVSDVIPSLDNVFGGYVAQVEGPAELKEYLEEVATLNDENVRLDMSRYVSSEHSFDARAMDIVNDVCEYVGLPPPCEKLDGSVTPFFKARKKIRIAALPVYGPRHATSSGFIRLICPLTSEAVSDRVDFKLISDIEHMPDNCDAMIVQRTAIESVEKADLLVKRLRSKGIHLIVDNDDAFSLIDETHPEFRIYSEKNVALEKLMSEASQTWLSTSALNDLYGSICRSPCVIPNSLDPRIWRDYRKPRPACGDGDKIQLLYMGTATHDSDLDLIMPALDALAAQRPGSFELTIIGVARKPPCRPWVKVNNPPAGYTNYPKFVRWLLQQGPYDIGLAPLVDNPFNRCKSDIKFLDYCALGILPVLSDIRVYSGSEGAQHFGVIAGNTVSEWYDVLFSLIICDRSWISRLSTAQTYLWDKRNSGMVARMQVDMIQQVLE